MLYPATLPNLDNLWNDRNPELMENKLRYLLEPAAINARCYYLQLQTQIARAQAAQGKYESAHATLDSIEAELSDGVDAARVRCLIERARIYLMQGDFELAESILKRASDRAGFYYPNLLQQVRQLLDRAQAPRGAA